MENERSQSQVETDQRSEQIQTAKNKQRGALSALTKWKNHLNELMSDSDNIGEVKEKYKRFKELYSNYSDSFNALLQLLNENEKEEEIIRFKARITPVMDLKTELLEWMAAAENQIYDQLENKSLRAKSRTSARSSSRSKASTTSSRLREKAKLAELLIEKEMLAQQQAMQAQQAQRQEMLAKEKQMELNIEIAKMKARTEVYEESSTRSDTTKQHEHDVTKPVFRPPSHGSHRRKREDNPRQLETHSRECELKE